jgi:ABC-type glutathione transport system ATPase component
LAERGKKTAVLFFPHDLGNLAETAHEFVFLHEGRVRFRGSREAVLSKMQPGINPTTAFRERFRRVVEKELA